MRSANIHPTELHKHTLLDIPSEQVNTLTSITKLVFSPQPLKASLVLQTLSLEFPLKFPSPTPYQNEREGRWRMTAVVTLLTPIDPVNTIHAMQFVAVGEKTWNLPKSTRQ